MKSRFTAPLFLGASLVFAHFSSIAQSFQLEMRALPDRVELRFPSVIQDTNQSFIVPRYVIQGSRDLQQWESLSGRIQGLSGRTGAELSVTLDRQSGPIFYRLKADTSASANEGVMLADGGEEVFGWGEEFQKRLKELGEISVGDFLELYPPAAYLVGPTQPPTQPAYWTNFNTDPVAWNAGLPTNSPLLRTFDFRLNSGELALFQRNGFVVSERLGSYSFGDLYYRLYNDDLPVFITSDSVLHAWHRSYQSMMEELEELMLAPYLCQVISNMTTRLPAAWQQARGGPLEDSVLDADYFLAVANSLFVGSRVSSALGIPAQDQAVAQTLANIEGLTLQEVPIFDGNRWIDFSQFRVRGHYGASLRLSRYFQAAMWCGRVDLRLAGSDLGHEGSIRQLGTAVVLNSLLRESGQFEKWQSIEKVVSLFVGPTDSMTFIELKDLLESAGIRSLTDVPDFLTLTNLQTRLLTGELGRQNIQGEFGFSPGGPEEAKLARSFTVAGQKFVVDSWAFNQVTFDRVRWDADLGTNAASGKVLRRKPTALDTAFSVLANNNASGEIAERITNSAGVPFRDGLPYQHNLAATRQVIDQLDPSTWTNNIYWAWLSALRALSEPIDAPGFPEAMRTRAWAMKDISTQLASWTQLRHDTVLYAKQSYTENLTCGYPDGFVEPRPEFWKRMRILARVAANAIQSLPLQGRVEFECRSVYWPEQRSQDLAWIQSIQVAFLNSFADKMATLESIATRELAQQPLTQTETDFLKNVMEIYTVGYTHSRQWNGWYPGLYYGNCLGCEGPAINATDTWDALVTDVHTDPPDGFVGDPGAIIHEATGDIHLLMITVDNGPDRAMYAGPVFSHYEFEMPANTRLTDSEWQSKLRSAGKPPPPEWTEDYLVPYP